MNCSDRSITCSETSDNMLYGMVWFWTSLKINFYNLGKYLYDNFEIARNTTDNIQDFLHDTNKCISSFRIENNGLWLSVNSNNNNKLIENIIKFKQCELNNEFINNFLQVYKISKKNQITSNDLILLKLENKRILKLLNNEQNINLNSEKTLQYFLNIEYSHPNMDENIEISLTNDYYFENNEVLSSVFILRYLEYQDKPFVYDNNYKINILDNNINSVTLNSDQYILFNKNNYIINEIKKI